MAFSKRSISEVSSTLIDSSSPQDVCFQVSLVKHLLGEDIDRTLSHDGTMAEVRYICALVVDFGSLRAIYNPAQFPATSGCQKSFKRQSSHHGFCTGGLLLALAGPRGMISCRPCVQCTVPNSGRGGLRSSVSTSCHFKYRCSRRWLGMVSPADLTEWAFYCCSSILLSSSSSPSSKIATAVDRTGYLDRILLKMAPSTVSDDPPARNFVPTACHDTYKFISPEQWPPVQRRVLITGASKGIGQAMAISYARAGYSHIALLARTSVRETVERAQKAAAEVTTGVRDASKFLEISADLTSKASIDAAASLVAREFGSLDILVNNAGYLEQWTPIIDSDPDQWWRTWEVNVRGTYLMNRAFIPLLLKGSEKTTITVSSVGAWVTKAGASAYQGSKTAQVRLANHLMAEYGDQVRAAPPYLAFLHFLLHTRVDI